MDKENPEAGDSDYRVTYNEDYNDGDKLRERMDKQFSEVRRRLTDVLKVLQWALVTIAVLVTVIICLLAVILVNTEDSFHPEDCPTDITTPRAPLARPASNLTVSPPSLSNPPCPPSSPPWELAIFSFNSGEWSPVTLERDIVICKEDCDTICYEWKGNFSDCQNVLSEMNLCQPSGFPLPSSPVTII